MSLSNKNKKTTNYTRSSKPKKAKPSEPVEKRGVNKSSDNEREIKKQEVKKCKTYGAKHKEDYWQLKTQCFICHKMKYIAAKCLEKSNSRPSSSYNTQAKKQLYYSQKVTWHRDSKT